MASKKKNVPDLKELLHAPRHGATITPIEGADVKRVRIPLDQIDYFEDNPRTRPNEQFEEIKESIRQDGLHNELDVTQRPGEDRFVLDRGGNTRLKALKELLEEGEDRFAEIWVKVHPYVSETVIQTRHLVENNTRADMSFWDNARAHIKLWRAIEAEEGKKIAARNLAEAFAARGLVIQSKSVLYLYQFACKKLGALGDDVAQLLSGKTCKSFQPFYNNIVTKLLDAWPLEGATTDQLMDQWLKEYGKEVLSRENPEITFESMERFFYQKLQNLTGLDRRQINFYIQHLDRWPEHETRLKMLQTTPEESAPVLDIGEHAAAGTQAEHEPAATVETVPASIAAHETSGGTAEHGAASAELTVEQAYEQVHHWARKIWGLISPMMDPGDDALLVCHYEGLGFWLEPYSMEDMPPLNLEQIVELTDITWWAALSQLSLQWRKPKCMGIPEDSNFFRVLTAMHENRLDTLEPGLKEFAEFWNRAKSISDRYYDIATGHLLVSQTYYLAVGCTQDIRMDSNPVNAFAHLVLAIQQLIQTKPELYTVINSNQGRGYDPKLDVPDPHAIRYWREW